MLLPSLLRAKTSSCGPGALPGTGGGAASSSQSPPDLRGLAGAKQSQILLQREEGKTDLHFACFDSTT